MICDGARARSAVSGALPLPSAGLPAVWRAVRCFGGCCCTAACSCRPRGGGGRDERSSSGLRRGRAGGLGGRGGRGAQRHRRPIRGRGRGSLLPAGQRGEMLSWIPRAHALSMGSSAARRGGLKLESRVAAFTKGTKPGEQRGAPDPPGGAARVRGVAGRRFRIQRLHKVAARDPPPRATWTARQLRLLKGFIDHAHIGSICPSQVDENLGALAAMAPPHPRDPDKVRGRGGRGSAAREGGVGVRRRDEPVLRRRAYPLSDMANHDPTSGFARTLPFSDSACLPPMLGQV